MYHIATDFMPISKPIEECQIQEIPQCRRNKSAEDQDAAGLWSSVFIKLHFVQLLVDSLSVLQTGMDLGRGSGIFWLPSGTSQDTKVLS